MGEIQVPGRPSPTNNPLLVLAAVGQGVIDQLKVIAANTAKEPRHIYALGEGNEPGAWGSYCLACSDAASEYIWPCAKHPERSVPPSHITVLEQGVNGSAGSPEAG